ncbi:MAG: ATP-dependent Clp protease proteolytic subunit [Bacteroidota bacterium]
MEYKSEFLNYASGHHGLSRMHLEKYIDQHSSRLPRLNNFTPSVVEERQLNMVQMDVFSRLMMDRIIFLGRAVDDYVANVIQAQLLFMESVDPKRDISLYINSPGGSVTAGLGIYDTMQYVSPDIGTICTGISASMAAVLLASGTAGKRTCLTHSRVMIHQPSGGMQGQVADMEISYQLFKSMQKELYDILARHTGQPYEKINIDCDRDHWMVAKEAQDYGLVDEVLSRKEAA